MADEQTVNDPVLDAGMQALVDIVKAANTTDAMQAQAILLRRLALQGDVTGSRVPPPQNITEIGGYLNYLENLNQPEMRAQALAGILGVAGPNPPLGWQTTMPPVSFVALANHRPPGDAQAAIPLSVYVRSDFQAALSQALADVAAQGAALPLIGTAPPLPPATSGVTTEPDVLAFLGRVLHVVPAAALADVAADPILLARLEGSTDPWTVMARVLAPGTVPVTADDWEALECDDTACTATAVSDTALVDVEAALANAGFHRVPPAAVPASNADPAWARFENRTGLVAGLTRLGDELSLLYDPAAIASSVFHDRQGWIWNGTEFAA